MSVYAVVLCLHILAAMVLIGSGLFTPLLRRALQGAGSIAQLSTFLDLDRRATRANPAAALVLLATGIYLGKDGWWMQAWFWVSVAAWLTNAVLAAAVIQRSAAALAAAAARAGSGGVPPELEPLRRSMAWSVAEHVLLANDLAILYVMIEKPSLPEALAALVVVHALLAGGRTARARLGGGRTKIAPAAGV